MYWILFRTVSRYQFTCFIRSSFIRHLSEMGRWEGRGQLVVGDNKQDDQSTPSCS